MTDSNEHGANAQQGEIHRLLVHCHQLENLVLFAALAQGWPEDALAVVEDRLDRLLQIVRARPRE